MQQVHHGTHPLKSLMSSLHRCFGTLRPGTAIRVVKEERSITGGGVPSGISVNKELGCCAAAAAAVVAMGARAMSERNRRQ